MTALTQALVFIGALAFARLVYVLIEARRKRTVRDAWVKRVIG